MRITELQLRRIVREEIMRESDLRGATFVRDASGKWVPSGGSDWEGEGAQAASALRRPQITGRRKLAGITDPADAAQALVDLLGREGAEELADVPYSATGSTARAAEDRFADELRAAGAGPLADDRGWASDVYIALTDLVNPWDALR